MIVIGFPAAAFGTNCYVVADSTGQECLVVDPGIGVLDQLADVLAEHRLRPAAVLLTHGHVDHVASVTPVCGAHGVAAHIHGEDAYRLADPISGLDPQLVAMFARQFGAQSTWTPPQEVLTLTGGVQLTLAGLKVEVLHAPGHTEGSVMFVLEGVPQGLDAVPQLSPQRQLTSTVLTGDVLFAGSIGRTDLAGGDHAAMLRSLREKVLPLPDPTLVLPGHGPATTIEHERATNPYLTRLAPSTGR